MFLQHGIITSYASHPATIDVPSSVTEGDHVGCKRAGSVGPAQTKSTPAPHGTRAQIQQFCNYLGNHQHCRHSRGVLVHGECGFDSRPIGRAVMDAGYCRSDWMPAIAGVERRGGAGSANAGLVACAARPVGRADIMRAAGYGGAWCRRSAARFRGGEALSGPCKGRLGASWFQDARGRPGSGPAIAGLGGMPPGLSAGRNGACYGRHGMWCPAKAGHGFGKGKRAGGTGPGNWDFWGGAGERLVRKDGWYGRTVGAGERLVRGNDAVEWLVRGNDAGEGRLVRGNDAGEGRLVRGNDAGEGRLV